MMLGLTNLLSGCVILPGDVGNSGTLASIDLQYAADGSIADSTTAVIPRSDQEIKQAYYDYLKSNASVQSSTRSAVTRLAQMELEISQRLLSQTSLDLAENHGGPAATNSADLAYVAALKKTAELLNGALEQFPEDPNNDEHLYQLARTYEQLENAEQSLATMQTLVSRYPDSRFAAEVHFRLGEYLFAESLYLKAEDAYTESIFAQGNERFSEKALFKRGWSRYKQELYIDAMDDFVSAVRANPYRPDSNVARDQRTQEVFAEYFRAFGLAYSHIEAEMTLSEYFEGMEDFAYLFDSYQSVVNLYRGQDRYQQAIALYDDFRSMIERRQDDSAETRNALLLASIGSIELYREDKREAQAISAIEDLLGDTRTLDLKQLPNDIAEAIPGYTATLASYYHRQLDASQNKIATNPLAIKARELYTALVEKHLAYAKKSKLLVSFAELEKTLGAFDRAVVLFSEQGFAKELSTTELNDSLASAPSDNKLLNLEKSLGQLPQLGDQQALVLNLNAANLSLESLTDWFNSDFTQELGRNLDQASISSLAISTAQTILRQHPANTETIGLTINLAKTLNAAERYSDSIELLDQIAINSERSEDGTAIRLVLAEAFFSLNDFVSAAGVYSNLLGLNNSVESEKSAIDASAISVPGLSRVETQEVKNRLALSYYRQAEATAVEQASEEKTLLAMKLYAKASEIIPGSDVAQTGLYDALSIAINREDWTKVIQYGERYSALYPDGAFYAEVQKSLSQAFLKSDDTDRAAESLQRLASSKTDDETKAAALWRAGELFESKKANRKAIKAYEQYAKQFPKPLLSYLEAQWKIAGLSKSSSQNAPSSAYQQAIEAMLNRKSELRRTQSADLDKAEPQVLRANKLISQAHLAKAVLTQDRYKQVQLVSPIKATLRRKKELLQSSSRDLGTAAAFGFTEIASEATHRLGELYADFSQSLINSERPDNLDDDALEQYEILIEDQAFPFEDQSIVFFEQNLARSKTKSINAWNSASLKRLRELFPVRYKRDPLIGNIAMPKSFNTLRNVSSGDTPLELEK